MTERISGAGEQHQVHGRAVAEVVPGLELLVDQALFDGIECLKAVYCDRGYLVDDLDLQVVMVGLAGPVMFGSPLHVQEDVPNERISLVFEELRIVRMVDAKRNTLVYLTGSDRLIEAAPQNAVTALAVDRGPPTPVR